VDSAKVVTGYEAARKASRESAKQMKEDMHEARGSIMVLGEEIGVHLPRHVQAFVATMPGVATAMSSAFAPLAVIAIGMAIFEAGKKAFEYGEKMKEAAKKQEEASRELIDSLLKSNLAQQVENDKLDEKIAKLEHKPVNTLQKALDDARKSAFELSEQLQKAIDKERELLDSSNANLWQRLLGAASNDSVKKSLDDYQQKMKDEENRHNNELDPNGWSVADALRGRKLSPLEEQIENGKNKVRITEENYNQNRAELMRRKRYQELRSTFSDTGMTDEYAQLEQEFNKTGSAGDQTNIILSLERHINAIGAIGHGLQELVDRDTKSQHLAVLEGHEEGAKAAAAKAKKWLAEIERDGDAMAKLAGDEAVKIIRENTASLKLLDRIQADLVRGGKAWVAATVDGQLAANKAQREMAKGDFQGTVESSGLRVEAGEQSAGSRIAELRRALDLRHGLELQSLNADLALYNQGTREYEKVLSERRKADAEYFKDQAALQREAMEQGVSGAFTDLVRRSQNFSAQFKEMIEGTVNTMNDALLRTMTEPHARGQWKDAGKSIFVGVARTGLQDAEGSLLKAFGLGGLGKMGTQGNPMWVKMAGIGGAASGVASAIGSAAGDAGGFMKAAGAVFKFLGAMDGGGLMQPGGYYLTGERGPELMRVGATSRIAGSRDTKALLSGGGGGVTNHHTWNIDARGANDPAAVQIAVQRAIQSAAPHLISASMMAMDERQARRPNLR